MRAFIDLVEALNPLAIEKTAAGLDAEVQKIFNLLSRNDKEDGAYLAMGIWDTDGPWTEMLRPNSPAFNLLLYITFVCDPTPKGLYSKWLFRMVLNRTFAPSGRFFEDLSSFAEFFLTYDEAKPRLPQNKRDINGFKSATEFMNFVDDIPAELRVSNRAADRQLEAELITNRKITILHDDEEVKIAIPHSEEAAIVLGRNTRWCTAARVNNAFEDYAADGNLIVVLFKKENRRYQIHIMSGQIMDEKDHEFDLRKLCENAVVRAVVAKEIHKVTEAMAAVTSGYTKIGNQIEENLWNTFYDVAKPFSEEENRALLMNWCVNPEKITPIPISIPFTNYHEDVVEYVERYKRQLEPHERHLYRNSLAYIKDPSRQACQTALAWDGTNIEYVPEAYIDEEMLDRLGVETQQTVLEYMPKSCRNRLRAYIESFLEENPRLHLTYAETADSFMGEGMQQVSMDSGWFSATGQKLPPVDTHVWSDPTSEQLHTAIHRCGVMDGDPNLRGFAHDGHVYVWPAWDATHNSMVKQMGLDAGVRYWERTDFCFFQVWGSHWAENDDRKIIISYAGTNAALDVLLNTRAKRWRPVRFFAGGSFMGKPDDILW